MLIDIVDEIITDLLHQVFCRYSFVFSVTALVVASYFPPPPHLDFVLME